MLFVFFFLRLWWPREEQEDGRRFLSVFSAAGERRREEQDAQAGEFLMFSWKGSGSSRTVQISNASNSVTSVQRLWLTDDHMVALADHVFSASAEVQIELSASCNLDIKLFICSWFLTKENLWQSCS